MSTVPSDPGVRSLKRAQVRVITVFFMIYILVSGGSFGIEDMVSSSGPGLTLLLFISAYVLIFISAVRLRIKEPDLKRPFRVPFGTPGMVAMVVPPILIVLFTIYVNAIDRSTVLLGFDGFNLLGVDVGWYGIAGFVALFSGPVLYYVFRAIYGGPGNPSSEAGNEALALAEAEAAEDAA